MALFIVPERTVEGFDHFVNGKALGRTEHLERIAANAGVRPLMNYYSLDPEEGLAFLEGEGVDPPPEGLPPLAWFEAEDGLQTVRGLLEYLLSNPASLQDQEAVVQDLREFESVLSRLHAEGIRWHLAVDY